MSIFFHKDDDRDPPPFCPKCGGVHDNPGDGLIWRVSRHKKLLWGYVPEGGAMTPRDAVIAITKSFLDWDIVFPLPVEYTSDLSAAHMVFGWYTKDGAGNVLAQAELPVWHYPRVSRCWFDRDEDWEDVDFESVALHEIGHLLGVRHLPDFPEAVMAPFYHGPQRELTQHDITACRNLYYVK